MRFLFLPALMILSLGAEAATDYKSLMNVNEAQQITRGNTGLVIATLNTGVNYDLPEFRGRIPRNEDGTYGYDAIKNRTDAMDQMEFGLGTKVASLIAGNTLGVAPDAKLLPIRIFDENGSTDDAALLRGVTVAVNSGAKIIEFGGGPLSNMNKPLCQAFQKVDELGLLLVLPAGNDGTALKEYPENCPIRNLIVSTAADARGSLADFATYGFSAIHVAAPGVQITAMGRDGAATEENSGGSFASGLTAGVAALVWSAHPEFTATQVRTALIRGSTPTEGLRGKVRSNGLLNALGAIQADTSRAE